MRLPPWRFALPALAFAVSALARAGEPDPFTGQYGHGATDDPDEVVWIVQPQGAHWRITRTSDDDRVDAHPLAARGREAFWARMDWPVDSSRDADCLTWGEKPASLADLLADAPPSPAATGAASVGPNTCTLPSARSMPVRPGLASAPPSSPNGGMRRRLARMPQVIASRKRMRRIAPSPPRHLPAPPEPRRMPKSSTTTG